MRFDGKNRDPGLEKSIQGSKIDPGTEIPLGYRSQCRPLYLSVDWIIFLQNEVLQDKISNR